MNFDIEGKIPLTKIQSSATTDHLVREAPTNGFLPQDDFKNDEEHSWSGRRKARITNSRPIRAETRDTAVEVNKLGRLYKKFVRFSIVTQYLVYVVPMTILISIPLVIYAICKPNELFVNTGVRVHLFWAWIEIVWLSFWGSKLLSKAMPHFFVTLCGVVSAGIRKYATILNAVEFQLSLVSWLIISLVAFTGLMSPGLNNQLHQKHWIPVVRNFLGASLVASTIYLAEKMFVQLVSVNYHSRSFDNRIKEIKNCIRLMSILYESSRELFPTYCEKFYEEDNIIDNSFKNKLNKKKEFRSGTTTPLRIAEEIGRISDKVTTAFGNIASEITGKQVFNTHSANSVVCEALRKAKSAEALAKRLWMSFVLENQEVLKASDIKEVFGPTRHEEAEECFAILDVDSNGDISLDEMIMRVVKIGRDRKTITAIAFQNKSFVTTLATAGTTLLSLSFVFAVTTQEFLGSCIFLFVKHPYDVGDRCDINNTAVFVEQISLLFTVFKRVDTMKLVQIPNIVLNTLWIENTTRSKAMKEQVEIFISFDTPLEDIEKLRNMIESFVRHPDNSRDFQPDIIIETMSINSMDKLTLRIEVRHKSNWHNENVRTARRSKLMCALVVTLQKIPIYAPGGGKDTLGGPKNPNYTVAVTDEWAANARQKSKEEKESKRLVLASSEAEEMVVESQQKSEPKPLNPGEDIVRIVKIVEVDANNRSNEAEDDKSDKILRSENDRRSDDIESLRQDFLKRQSTRGRRKPGNIVQPMSYHVTSQRTSSNAITQISDSQIALHQKKDEESQIDTQKCSRLDKFQ
ncbi:putative MscS family protein [Golovinomyces cichoracearum]|uniref:Mechanosensitive ion channel protein n=1 Tax=Golovinomyces cichoracearum TaxID=62708 RepID=A0A420IX97_9PEZI|nr:putative MscS family protein [Golovinomyces cichoracearum]